MSNMQFDTGTVAVATVGGVPNVRVMRAEADGMYPWVSVDVDGAVEHRDSDVTDIRPLVVLDPEGSPTALGLPAEWLRNAARDLAALDEYTSSRVKLLTYLADQIEQQTKPPKPEEPTGLGAVVEDAEGRRWVCSKTITTVCHWRPAEGGRRLRWSDLPASVRVLSEGVAS